jgi:hypothetical protein
MAGGPERETGIENMSTTATDGPKTCDGVPFVLGMTLVTRGGNERPTNPDEFEITTLDQHGRTYYLIGRKGAGMSMDVEGFFSSQAARLGAYKSHLEQRRREIDEEIGGVEREIKELGG